MGGVKWREEDFELGKLGKWNMAGFLVVCRDIVEGEVLHTGAAVSIQDES